MQFEHSSDCYRTLGYIDCFLLIIFMVGTFLLFFIDVMALHLVQSILRILFLRLVDNLGFIEHLLQSINQTLNEILGTECQ